ncbi:universal stress protein [Desulfobulbus oligotrophicus]|jgi:nucleotide-binding universal stress UspA family protein|uniref:Universal stress protein n=1 Tax=Desulfobulbus oligotrophicus TaxID=1909699 RepID=A0A7T5VBY0_9BACT|nr:universal stress protein [Desulfobulbus oligotrophicus]MDY0390016.1 universal stress protein [Desulfobulbus oligotrophicus]QQG64981.1 universal stress protein [Desulfobulbus oligotrophicus]
MVPAPIIQTILYATDLGKNARAVFRLAVSMARHYDARLLILNVVEPLGTTGSTIIANYLSGETAEKINRDAAHDILHHMKERLARYSKEEMDAFGLDWAPPTDILVATGIPSEVILQIAKRYEADMIVVGTSSRSFLGSAMMGSTARRVSRHSTIPVLVVPITEE